MANTRKLIVEVVGDTRKLDRSFKSVETRTQKLGKRLAGLGKAGAIGAGVAGTALLVKGLKDSVNAAVDAEQAQNRLAGAFKSAGADAADMAKATAAISRVSRQAALDDEDLSDSLANLTRTSGSAQKGLRGMALAADIARARNISLGAATKIVEKAFVGQFRGLKAVGVQIDKTTTTTQALQRANEKFAGSAERFSSTTAAAQQRLSVAFENLEEKIGAKLIPAMTALTIKATAVVDAVNRHWPEIEKQIDDITAVLRVATAAAGQLFNVLNRIANIKIPFSDSNIFRVIKAVTLHNPTERAVVRIAKEINKRVGDDDKAPKPKRTQRIPTAPEPPPPSNRPGTRRTQSVTLDGLGRDVVVHTQINLDGDRVATNTTRHQQKTRRRNPPQKRGPNRVSGV